MVLNLLRKRKTIKRIMWAVAILIVPAFVFWGSENTIKDRGNMRFRGTILGKKVSQRDYAQALRACRNQAQLMYGDNFSEVAEYLNLEGQAWNRLILLRGAKRKKISVTDDEIINWIKTSLPFQKEGKFDRERYQLILQYFLGIEPREFEEELRDSLKIAKLREDIVREVRVSDSEIKEAYRRENEKAKVSYILIESKDFAEKAAITQEELNDYYKDNREEFRLSQRVNVEYLNLAFEQFKKGVSIADEDIEDYYNTNLEEFTQPRDETKEENEEPEYKSLPEVKDTIKSDLIFQEAKRKAQNEASKIIEELFDQPDFAKIAPKYALSFKETGFFTPQESIPDIGFSYQFTKQAFSLTEDEISGIIPTPRGLYIIRLKEKKASYIPSFEEAKTEIEKAVRKIKMEELARQKAEEILVKIKESGFKEAAKKLSLTIKKSEPFTRKGYIPDIGEAPGVSSAAFDFGLQTGEISEVTSTPKGYLIFQLDNIEELNQEKFEQEKEKFKQAILGQKKEKYFQSWFMKLKQEANLKSNLPK